MAKLYWRLKLDGKWSWKPVKFGRLSQEEVVRELIFYNKIERPEEDE